MQKPLLFSITLFTLLSCKEITADRKHYETDTAKTIGEEDITPDLKKLRQEYIRRYNEQEQFENLVAGKNSGQIKVNGKYYCLFDSAIVIPPMYNLDDTTKSFITHNFAEDIIIVSNGDTILKKTITKEYFSEKLPQYLKDYAIILAPVFEDYDKHADIFNFRFSISIPLTDIGQSVKLGIKRNGQIAYIQSE